MADQDWQARLKTGRNDDCPCGSGKKYKKCHLQADEKAQSEALAKTNAEAAEKAKAEGAEHEGHDHHGHDRPHGHGHSHDKGGAKPHSPTAHMTKQVNAPRKTGAS
ncbi:MAG TPA: SEC-C metal-binding domain-containing protein [bacterium]|nr:SEC-C metal-binding domain-containing protein [bacterium]